MKLWVNGIILLISFSVLVLQFYITSKRGINRTTDVVRNGGSLTVLNQRHLLSLIAMIVAIMYIGFTHNNWLDVRTFLDINVLALTALTALAAGRISIIAAYKNLRKEQPKAAATGSPELYLLLRGFFLVGYEFFFRAVLLDFCIARITIPAAIIINVVLYAIAHIFSNRQELIGSVPFGFVLCLITLYTKSVWPAVIIHVMLGLPYDVLTLYAPKRITKTFSL